MMNISKPIILTAPGISAPVALLGPTAIIGDEPIALKYLQSPAAFVVPSPDAAGVNWTVEVSCDQPDENGVLPARGLWVPSGNLIKNGSINLEASATGQFCAYPMRVALDVMATAVRLRVITLSAGSLTFAVVQ